MRWRSLEPKVLREKNTARVYLGDGTFTFNNETRPFTGDWNDPAARKLWLYNLHYMGWLFDITGEGAPVERETWIERWIRENPPATGNGWEPYPLSLRIFNWCKHYSLLRATPRDDVRELLEIQAGRLLANLEFHLDGNHLLENLLALTYAGFHLDPGARRSRRALARIGRLLGEELDAQFLEDGGHYELSPMYHAILLERLLDLLNAWPEAKNGEDPFPGLREKVLRTALRALDWLDVMSVGGKFSLFNDSCYDAAPEAGRLLEFGGLLLGWKSKGRQPLRSLPDSGYYRAEAGPFTVIFDAGKLGPDHQMGHAQCDLLSFCLWVNDEPVIVHPGNYEYVAGEMRDYCRSTAAHNTLAIEGAEQAEWWGSHRVGRRPRPLEAGGVVETDGTIRLWGAHDGFSHLRGCPLHQRSIELRPAGLEIQDHLTEAGGHVARRFFHMHPDAGPFEESALAVPGGRLTFDANDGKEFETGESWYCPEFGMRRRSIAVSTPYKSHDSFMKLNFVPKTP